MNTVSWSRSREDWLPWELDGRLASVGVRLLKQETHMLIRSDADIVVARQEGRILATVLGFSPTESTLIATAISELARNIIQYAKQGEILLEVVEERGKEGLVVVARDDGPGILDVRRALTSGYSTGGGLGLGLPGVRRLMDEFEITSELGEGTTVVIKKWRR